MDNVQCLGCAVYNGVAHIVYNILRVQNDSFIHFEYNTHTTHPKHCTSKTGQGARGTYNTQTTNNACTCTEYMYAVHVHDVCVSIDGICMHACTYPTTYVQMHVRPV